MKVSFNGMRRNLTRATNSLTYCLQRAIENNEIRDEKIANSLIEKINDVQGMVRAFNYLHDKEVEGDIDDLSDELDVIFIEERKTKMATYTVCDMEECRDKATYSISKEARKILEGVCDDTEDICEHCLTERTNFDELTDKLEIDCCDQIVLKWKN